ncbi:MAG TPA: hypothetical protein PKK74_05215, partial [Candidatus Methanoculleus thermohydrogenotrophicum]|nr:hypothetical protein [Candidatus Methanoculleus thermohydrogenotrophicum]
TITDTMIAMNPATVRMTGLRSISLATAFERTGKDPDEDEPEDQGTRLRREPGGWQVAAIVVLFQRSGFRLCRCW